MVADITGVIGNGREAVVVADTSIIATTIPLIQFSSDTAETAGGAVLEEVIKDTGVGVKITVSNAVQKDVPFLYKRATRTGTATIPAGKDRLTVASGSVSVSTMVCVVLTKDPSEAAGGASVEYVEVYPNAGGGHPKGFQIFLSDKVTKDTTFDYYVVAKTGTGTIASGKDHKKVTDAAFVSATNVIFVALTSNPGDIAGGAVVEWVDISGASLATPTTDFVVWLRTTAQKKTTFDYIIL
jgi:hypothetical protein